VSIDDRTGVIDSDDPDLYRRFADHVVAVHCRLGNVGTISKLDDQIQEITADELPMIRNTVLGSGAHCVDLIEVRQLDLLRRELTVLTARWSAVESYTWSPSHDQCGMLRPFGTSSADWW
jgi:hypothetical protein